MLNPRCEKPFEPGFYEAREDLNRKDTERAKGRRLEQEGSEVNEGIENRPLKLQTLNFEL
jgi:hypothetical protein